MKDGMGIHILANFLDCPNSLLKKKQVVKRLVMQIIKEAKLRKIKDEFHQFRPDGVTGFVLLWESHLSVHTWPEYNSIAVDIFCCYLNDDGKLAAKKKADKTYTLLIQKFKPGKVKKKVIIR